MSVQIKIFLVKVIILIKIFQLKILLTNGINKFNSKNNNSIQYSLNSNRNLHKNNKKINNSYSNIKQCSRSKKSSKISRKINNNINMNQNIIKKNKSINKSIFNQKEINTPKRLKSINYENKINVVQYKVNKEINNLFNGLSDNIDKDPEIHNKIESLIKEIKDIEQALNKNI